MMEKQTRRRGPKQLALFSFEKFWEMDTVAFSFVFDKYCPIMN